MSIYSTLWSIKLPRYGDDYPGCEWIRIWAQGVPAHIGSPNPGAGYEDGDPYAAFQPPPITYREFVDDGRFRAVVFVTDESKKGTERSGQEYVDPILVLTGADYEQTHVGDLLKLLCDALHGGQPRCTGYGFQIEGKIVVYFSDGSTRIFERDSIES